MLTEVLLTDVLTAARRLAPLLPPTPMWSYPALNEVAGAALFVKHENTQPVGAFKVRGGLNLFALERPAAVVTCSTGNHGSSLAYAAARHGAECTVVVPTGANPVKVRVMRSLGATVVEHGRDMTDAQEFAVKLAADRGARLVSPGDEPALLAGVGTAYLEMLTAEPDLDAIVVPVGSGTGAASAAVVAAALAPRCEVIAVQSAAAPAAHDSWRAGAVLSRPCQTAVEGLATGSGYALPQRLLRAHLADFVLVTDEQIGEARRAMARHAHTLAEGAGAAALAAVLAHPDRFAGRRVAIACTGGNANPAEMASL